MPGAWLASAPLSPSLWINSPNNNQSDPFNPGEGIGYSLQYSSASLVAHMVKNPSAMQETLVQFLGREDLLEKG